MDGDTVGPGFDEVKDLIFGTLDHEVGLDREGGHAANGLGHLCAEGDRRNEVSIHHVECDPIRSGRFCFPDLFSQARPVGAED